MPRYAFLNSKIEFLFFFLFRATPMAYGNSQVLGVATGACAIATAMLDPRLQPTPQLTAMPDP